MSFSQLFFKLNAWLEGNRIFTYLLLFLIGLIFFFSMQTAPVFLDPDSFYHIKMAELMSQEGVILDFPYFQFTTLRDSYTDHHFLYHIFLIPFVRLLPPMIGAKIAHVLLDCLVLITFFWLLNKLKVKGAFWYAILLLLIEPFIFRLGLVKAQPVSLIIIFVGVYLILTRRYWWLALMSFVYVWAYGGWFLYLILALLYVFILSLDNALIEMRGGWLRQTVAKLGIKRRHAFKKFIKVFWMNIFSLPHLKLVLSVFGGTGLGVLINPYFPKNLYFFWIQIINIGIVNYQQVIGVGNEWYPFLFSNFLRGMVIPLVLSLLALVVFLTHHRKYSGAVKFLLAVYILFLVASLKARRNVEYLAPFSVIFAAVIFSTGYQIREIRAGFILIKKQIVKFYFYNDWISAFLATVIVASAITVIVYLPIKEVRTFKHGISFNYLKSASEFLTENSNSGDIVFHSDWDDSPILFYHNHKNYYIVGLDPTFMYLANKDLYFKWSEVTLGQRLPTMYDIIKNDFGARYVLVSKDHKDFIRNLNSNFNFENVYEDDEAIVYRVL
ncbi:MAG TPA: hypothetical protein VJB67_00985 [Patescibacteria group bacterium]|nr:hypothetical protein [Patescibacteria group bacterium]